jgi:signal transduction histidine kinase
MSAPRDSDPDRPSTEPGGRLLSLAAHEFRTPASVVAGYLRMLQRDTETPLADRQRHMVDEAARSCARLVTLINDLSELARLDTGRATAGDEHFDLFTCAADAASTLAPIDTGVVLTLHGPDAGARVTGERARMLAACQAVFAALLREQAPESILRCDRRLLTLDGIDSAVLIVARDGHTDRAWTAAPRAFDDLRGGVGLSLPIARRVIEQAGGRLWSPSPDDEQDRVLRSAAIIALPLRG